MLFRTLEMGRLVKEQSNLSLRTMKYAQCLEATHHLLRNQFSSSLSARECARSLNEFGPGC